MPDIVVGQVTVPDVTDSEQGNAEQEIAFNYLAFAYALAEYSLTFIAGHVIRQTPAAGTDADPGTVVTLTLSLGQIPAVTVIATQAGFFGGLYRNIGDTFDLAHPEEYSPYWMSFVGSPPADWLPLLAVFSLYVDREMLEFGLPA